MAQEPKPDQRQLVERLYRDHYGVVLRYLLRRVDPPTAEDVTAETFLVAWRRLDSLPAREAGWLCGIARRVLANQRRASRRQKELVEQAARCPKPIVRRCCWPPGTASSRPRRRPFLAAHGPRTRSGYQRVPRSQRAAAAPGASRRQGRHRLPALRYHVPGAAGRLRARQQRPVRVVGPRTGGEVRPAPASSRPDQARPDPGLRRVARGMGCRARLGQYRPPRERPGQTLRADSGRPQPDA